MVVRNHVRTVRGGLLALLALFMSASLAPVPSSAQDAADWLPVTIVYNSDVGGKIDPCG